MVAQETNMTNAAADTFEPPVPSHRLLIALIIVGAIATLTDLWLVPVALYGTSQTDPLLLLVERLVNAKLLIAPLIAGAALLFALTGRVRAAIVTLGVLVLAGLVAELRPLVTDGPALSMYGPGALITFDRLAVPLLAIAAIVLALRGKYLWLAAALVLIPGVVFTLEMSLFAIAVMIYGF